MKAAFCTKGDKMVEQFKLIASLVLGVGLFVYGVIIIRRKEASVGIGGGRTGSAKPLGIVTLTGNASIMFGITIIIGGIIMVIPLISTLFPDVVPSVLNESLTVVGLVALAVVVIGFIFSAVIQLALNVGEGMRQGNEEGDTK
jgi:hypothetical protein